MAAAPGIDGRSRPRAESRRLAAGRGTYTGDILLPRLAHIVFVRSPHARARIAGMDLRAARAAPGIAAVFTGADLAAICRPFRTAVEHSPDHVSPPQPPLATGAAYWQGEAAVAVVAETRAQALDAADLVAIDWAEMPAQTEAEAALAAGAVPAHPALAHNKALERTLGAKDLPAAAADCTVKRRFLFGRQTGVPLEARTILADYNAAEDSLTVHQSHQVPHQMHDIFARHLGIPEHRVRVICRDVGGAFGIKLHAYPDELAVCAAAKLLGRPVKWVCDRTEAFVSDCHSREFTVEAALSARRDGTIAAIDASIVASLGAYSIYPRASMGDGVLVAMMLGAPYRVEAQRTHLRAAYLNKAPTGSYRGVGQPIGCAVTEQLMDDAAHALGLDPVAFRRRAYHRAGDYPLTTAGGLRFDPLSLHACLDRAVALMDYDGLRRDQATARADGIHRGIGVATFVEQTAPGAWLYGAAGIRISAQDGAVIRLEPSGTVRAEVGATDQGQGTFTGIAQIVAEALGVPVDNVAVSGGDSAGPYGGGAWASRGLSIAGEAALLAARALKANVLGMAAALLQSRADALDLRGGEIVDAATGGARMALAEVGRIGHFRPDLLPPGTPAELTAFRQFVPRTSPFFTANGVQACHLEVDVETGAIALLNFWVVEDCGRVINPALVDGQLRGGAVQGLGAALWEECVYDSDGQLLSGSLMDYALPRADALPGIAVAHVETAQPGTELGVKGAGEGGTIGAPAAVWCALNDALRPLGAEISRQPFTPERVFRALRAASPGIAARAPRR